MNRRKTLITKIGELKLSDKDEKELKADPANRLDSHAALAVTISNQIDVNTKMKEMMEKVASLKGEDLSFITQDNDALKGVMEGLLLASKLKNKEVTNCSREFKAGVSTEEVNGKTHKIPIFKAEPPNFAQCITWLDRIATACEGRTAKTWFETLEKYSEGNLLGTLRQWRKENQMDPKVVIPRIERGFGGVLGDAEANRQLCCLERKGNESIISLDVRIGALVDMAVRNETEDRAAITRECLSKTTLLRVIPAQLKNDFLEREQARIQMGEHPFTYRESVDELDLISTKLEELSGGKKVNAVGNDDSASEQEDDDGAKLTMFDLIGTINLEDLSVGPQAPDLEPEAMLDPLEYIQSRTKRTLNESTPYLTNLSSSMMTTISIS